MLSPIDSTFPDAGAEYEIITVLFSNRLVVPVDLRSLLRGGDGGRPKTILCAGATTREARTSMRVLSEEHDPVFLVVVCVFH